MFFRGITYHSPIKIHNPGLVSPRPRGERDNEGSLSMVKKEFAIIAVIFIVGALAVEFFSQSEQGTRYTFDALLDAMIQVESNGDPTAIGPGGEVGAFRISEIYLDDVNRIRNLAGQRIIIPAVCRTDIHMSREIVKIYLGHYAVAWRLEREPTLEDMARIHNGGPDGWKKESTLPYWRKVKAAMEDVHHEGHEND